MHFVIARYRMNVGVVRTWEAVDVLSRLFRHVARNTATMSLMASESFVKNARAYDHCGWMSTAGGASADARDALLWPVSRYDGDQGPAQCHIREMKA